MATGTLGTAARALSFQAVHYLRKAVNWNDSGIAAGVAFANPLPAGAVILPFASTIVVTTAFNAATTNNLIIGTTAAGNDICASADSAAGSTGVKTLALATLGTKAFNAADLTLYVAYTQTGTAASAGAAIVTIAYVINNDL